MRKAMEELKADPEMVKAMKQYGIDMNMIDKALNSTGENFSGSYYEFEEFMTPKKNVERINSIPKKALTNSELRGYLLKTEKCVDASFSGEDRQIADKLFSLAKSDPDTLANIASWLWMMGKYVPAVYTMGKACQIRPNVTNLNNYSAFLLMMGAEELALPILQKLNRENPKNSTILNNIGQAWFGLGDLDQAIKYLDSTIMIFATHSQANMTKSAIQQSKGDKAGAVQSMKQSIKEAYSPTKEEMLRKLGYIVEGKDLNNSALHLPPDPLGFNKWIETIPPFPKNLEEQMQLAQRWQDFYQNVLDEKTKLGEKAARLNIEYADSLVKRQKQLIANPYQNQYKEPYLSARANIVLKYYTDDKDGHNAGKEKMLTEKRTFTFNSMEAARKNAETKYEQLKRKYFDPIGEGQQRPAGNMCQEVFNTWNLYVNTANSELEAFTLDYLKFKSQKLEANAYFTQYITDLQPLIDFVETSKKIDFLVDLGNIRPVLGIGFTAGCVESEADKELVETYKLADWNDLHCDKDISFSVPYTGSFHFTCNSTTVNLDPLLIPFKTNFKQDLNTGELVNASASIGYGPVKTGAAYDFVKEKGSVQVEASQGIIDEKIGEAKAEAGVSGIVKVEFGKDGVTDFVMEAAGKIKIGNDNVIVSGDANVKWSWEAGGSGEAKGTIDSKVVQNVIKISNAIKSN